MKILSVFLDKKSKNTETINQNDNKEVGIFFEKCGTYIFYNYITTLDTISEQTGLLFYELAYKNNNKKALYDIAYCYYKMDEYNNSIKYFEDVLQHRELLKEDQIGYSYYILGHMTDNIEYYKKAEMYKNKDAIMHLLDFYKNNEETENITILTKELFEMSKGEDIMILSELLKILLNEENYDCCFDILEKYQNMISKSNLDEIACLFFDHYKKNKYLPPKILKLNFIEMNNKINNHKQMIINQILESRLEINIFNLSFINDRKYCNICANNICYNVKTACGHGMCNKCFSTLLKTNKKCPFCIQDMLNTSSVQCYTQSRINTNMF
jgi:tetratricopeptide (TPR) repeat protein